MKAGIQICNVQEFEVLGAIMKKKQLFYLSS